MVKKQIQTEELKKFQEEIINLPFIKRIEIYFSLSPVLQTDMEERKRIIFASFTERELRKYFDVFNPILHAIREYEDRVRTLKINNEFYNYHITTLLRQRSVFSNLKDFLNGLIIKYKNNGNEEITEDLQKYNNAVPLMRVDKESGLYFVSGIENTEEEVKSAIRTLRHILSALKSYLESLKEFLNSVGYPQLFPTEFKNTEKNLYIIYNGDLFKEIDVNAEGVERDFLLIDYKTIPVMKEIMGDGNLWKNSYERELKTK